MAVVVVLHLAPDDDSHLAELIKGRALWPVRRIKGVVEIEPDDVCVVSPDTRFVRKTLRWRCANASCREG